MTKGAAMAKTKTELPVTCIVLDLEVQRMLRELADLRSQRLGGRVSQSGTIRDLIREAAAKTKTEGQRG
jgi:hypothetical protein